MTEEETVTCLSAKEIKKLVRPEYEANPHLFYPTEFLESRGFERLQCPKCQHFFWRHKTSDHEVCGDSNCVGRYQFIGEPQGVGKDGYVSYQKAWDLYEQAMTTGEFPCTRIPRYPVVARWRSDVDYVAAGIYCFQPYCVTGELKPPANPLICPQFCLRFNDLDSIGISGRHHAGFIMIGNQAFNYSDAIHYWKNEVVAMHIHWMETMGFDVTDFTLIEDIWAGGGNMGPCVEIFAKGVEVGNMVLMQFRYFPDGSYTPLEVKVVDVGIGLERIPWLLNGSLTSYQDTHSFALDYLVEKTGVTLDNELWRAFAPYSCLLNVDECDDMDQAWQHIADTCEQDVTALRAAIEPARDLYIVADHSRASMIAIYDGSLPAQSGGAANLRSIIRRMFNILHERKTADGQTWWDAIGGVEGVHHLFELHQNQMRNLASGFKPYPSFEGILEEEYRRFMETGEQIVKTVKKLAKKFKKSNHVEIPLQEWIVLVTSQGASPDQIAQIIRSMGLTVDIPGNLYYEIAELQERRTAKQMLQLYDTVGMPPTEELFNEDESLDEFDASIVAIIPNNESKEMNMVALSRSAFYPTAGGQMHDLGVITINGIDHEVVNVEKIGRVLLHQLSEAIEVEVGTAVHGRIDRERRDALKHHHSAAHVINAAAKSVLGPHIWQAGAKKTATGGHLDITHYKGISAAEERLIEAEANRIVRANIPVNIEEFDKEEAEGRWGFSLYQGGAVAGYTVRVVDIEGVDTEACCGTHVQNTGELGVIRVVKTNRISDGVVRIYFTAGAAAVEWTCDQQAVFNEFQRLWNVEYDGVIETTQKFFDGYGQVSGLTRTLLDRTFRLAIAEGLLKQNHMMMIQSTESHMGYFMRPLKQHGPSLVPHGMSLFCIGPSWFIAWVNEDHHPGVAQLLEQAFAPSEDAVDERIPRVISGKIKVGKQKLDNYTELKVPDCPNRKRIAALKRGLFTMGFATI